MLKFVFSRRKVDAIFKRETAMACADPHQVIAIKLSLVHLKSGILAYIISFLFLFQVTWLLLDNIDEQIRERNSPRRDDCTSLSITTCLFCVSLLLKYFFAAVVLWPPSSSSCVFLMQAMHFSLLKAGKV